MIPPAIRARLGHLRERLLIGWCEHRVSEDGYCNNCEEQWVSALAGLDAALAAGRPLDCTCSTPHYPNEPHESMCPSAVPAGWRGIETAPKDEDVWFWVRPKTADESYTDTSGRPIVVDCEPRLHKGKRGTWGALWTATHWQPLNLPPAPVAIPPVSPEEEYFVCAACGRERATLDGTPCAGCRHHTFTCRTRARGAQS